MCAVFEPDVEQSEQCGEDVEPVVNDVLLHDEKNALFPPLGEGQGGY